MSDILKTNVDKVSNKGVKVKSGDRSEKFQSWLKSIGIDKEEMLKEFEESEDMSEMIASVKKRYMALKFYEGMVDITKDFYNDNNKRMLAMNSQLQEIDSIIRQHTFDRRKEDPTYSEVDDKQLLKWTQMRIDLMDKIRKQQMELTKMSLDKD